MIILTAPSLPTGAATLPAAQNPSLPAAAPSATPLAAGTPRPCAANMLGLSCRLDGHLGHIAPPQALKVQLSCLGRVCGTQVIGRVAVIQDAQVASQQVQAAVVNVKHTTHELLRIQGTPHSHRQRQVHQVARLEVLLLTPLSPLPLDTLAVPRLCSQDALLHGCQLWPLWEGRRWGARCRCCCRHCR